MTTTDDYQGMSQTVVSSLLSLIEGYDERFTWDDDKLLLWTDAAREGRWTQHEAVSVIRKFYLENASDQFISIGILHARIRAARQDALSREAAAITGTGTAFASADVRARLMARWQEAAAISKKNSQERRELVLKHEDLRMGLCAPEIGYTQPEQWNGWIPPELTETGARNTSPRRAALLALVVEAERRAEA